jgi:hypothetical protein
MSFSAITCVTVTGATMSPSATLQVFSNFDQYSTVFATVPLSDITGDNCPYILEDIPTGTTMILFRDPVSHCCLYLSVICCDYKQFQTGLCFEFQDYFPYYFQDQFQGGG